MTTVVTAFGTLTEEQISTLKKGLRELSDVMTMMEAQRNTKKEIIDALFDELAIPKSMIRKLAKVYHKANFSEVMAENEEFESIYVGLLQA